jgi:hypothetical protein
MINIEQVDWSYGINKEIDLSKGGRALAIAFIIDRDVVETLPLAYNFAENILNSDSFSDATDNFSKIDNRFIVNIIKNNNVVESLICNEMLYSILLSNPKMIDITTNDIYSNANMVAPGWKYFDNKFHEPESQ